MTTEAAARTVLARRLELAATIVMAAAAIFTAWAAFQSAKWSGIMSIEFARANAARVESTRLDDRASQLTAIDVDVFVAWLEAVDSEIRQGVTVIDPDGGYQPVDGTLSAFVYQRMRPEFLPALEAWLDTRPLSNPDAPRRRSPWTSTNRPMLWRPTSS